MSDIVPLEPSIIVIFGITGDLSKRYLLPALYHLIKVGLLDSQSLIIGVSRQQISSEELVTGIDLHLGEDTEAGDTEATLQFKKQIRMVQLDLDSLDDYKKLNQTLESIEAEKGRPSCRSPMEARERR